jgi:hypothetical protein
MPSTHHHSLRRRKRGMERQEIKCTRREGGGKGERGKKTKAKRGGRGKARRRYRERQFQRIGRGGR